MSSVVLRYAATSNGVVLVLVLRLLAGPVVMAFRVAFIPRSLGSRQWPWSGWIGTTDQKHPQHVDVLAR